MSAFLFNTPFGKRIRFIFNKDGKAGVAAGSMERLWEAMYSAIFGGNAQPAPPGQPLVGDAAGSKYLVCDFNGMSVAAPGSVRAARATVSVGAPPVTKNVWALYDSADTDESIAQAVAAARPEWSALDLVPTVVGKELRLVPRPGIRLEVTPPGIGSGAAPDISLMNIGGSFPVAAGSFLQLTITTGNAVWGPTTPFDMRVRGHVDAGSGLKAFDVPVPKGSDEAAVATLIKSVLDPLLPAEVTADWLLANPGVIRLNVATGGSLAAFDVLLGKP